MLQFLVQTGIYTSQPENAWKISDVRLLFHALCMYVHILLLGNNA